MFGSKSVITSLVLASSLAGAAEDEPMGLRVETSGLAEEQAGRLEPTLANGALAVLTNEGFEIVEGLEGPVVVLHVTMAEPELRLYRIEVVVEEDGETYPVGMELCPACNEQELLETALSLVLEVDSALEEEESGGSAVPRPVEPVEECPRCEEVVCEPLLGKWGIAGVAALGVGLGVAGVGTMFHTMPEETEDFDVTTPTTFGWATVAAGGAVALLGVSAILFDRVLARRGRDERALTFEASVSSKYAGMRVQGRF